MPQHMKTGRMYISTSACMCTQLGEGIFSWLFETTLSRFIDGQTAGLFVTGMNMLNGMKEDYIAVLQIRMGYRDNIGIIIPISPEKSVLWPHIRKSHGNIGFHQKIRRNDLTLLHSEWPKLHRVLAVLSAIGFTKDKKNNILSGVWFSPDVAQTCSGSQIDIINMRNVYLKYDELI